MRIRLVRIGNSRGVRLPKAMIEQAGLVDEVEVALQSDGILLRPVSKGPREGWDKAFRRALAAHGRDGPDRDWQTLANAFDEGWAP